MDKLAKNIVGLVTLWNLIVILIVVLRAIAAVDFIYLPDDVLIALLISNSILTVGAVWAASKFGEIDESDENNSSK